MTKTKKTDDSKTAKAKPAKGKSKKSKPTQLQLDGTGRLDAIEEIETQADVFVAALRVATEAKDEADVEQSKLTEIVKKHKRTEYVYVDSDGVKRLVYIPLEAKAKVKLVKPSKASDGDAE